MRLKMSGATDICYEFGKTCTETHYKVFSNYGTISFDTYEEALHHAKKHAKLGAPANVVKYTTIIDHICDVL